MARAGSGAHRVALSIAVAFFLSGFTASGKEVPDSHVDQFVRANTTKQEVISRPGPPGFSEHSAHGGYMGMHRFTKVAANAQSFIPLIGGSVGSTDTKTKTVRFTFYRNGILVDCTSSGRGAATNSGLLNPN